MHLIVVSGMLGVGKTSVMLKLIDQLIADGRKVCVIENDVGTKGIDGDIIRKNGMEVRELQGGCICCTMKIDLIETMLFLQNEFHPEIVLMEPTGIADPAYISSAMDVDMLDVEKVTIVIVVDAERFPKMRKMFERPLKNQLNVANLVLINKIDTVPEEDVDEIEKALREFSYEGDILRIQAEDGLNMNGLVERLL